MLVLNGKHSTWCPFHVLQKSQSVMKYLIDGIEEELGSKLPIAPCYSEASTWLSRTRDTQLPLSRKEEPSWMLKSQGGAGFRHALYVWVCCCLSSSSHNRAADWTPSWSKHFYAWAVWAVWQMLRMLQGDEEQGCEPQAHLLAPEALLIAFWKLVNVMSILTVFPASVNTGWRFCISFFLSIWEGDNL